ncbi:alpha-glucanase [Colletotrichum asianum]|uniref:Alpha-glucanase n=1 Tax=Colletotrichum asianum TaxID=702518 RepID=A0A8H3W5T8_9PEZI|nr:alpha-glucanase [Colletotrichum asianum]
MQLRIIIFLFIASFLAAKAVWADDRHNELNVNKRLDCFREPQCHRLREYTCKLGYTYVGFDRHTCNHDEGLPICCNTHTVERFGKNEKGENRRCEWTGVPDNCSGAGNTGEVVLFKSGIGGWPSEWHAAQDVRQCRTGYKYFSCPLPEWEALATGCRWTDCKGACGQDEIEVAHANDVDYKCPHQAVAKGVKYCCKKEKPPLSNCHWVGQGHCDDITCNPDEITAKRSLVGDGLSVTVS